MSRGSKSLPFTTIGEAFYSGWREWIHRVYGSAGFTLTISDEVDRALSIIHSSYEFAIITPLPVVTTDSFAIGIIT